MYYTLNAQTYTWWSMQTQCKLILINHKLPRMDFFLVKRNTGLKTNLGISVWYSVLYHKIYKSTFKFNMHLGVTGIITQWFNRNEQHIHVYSLCLSGSTWITDGVFAKPCPVFALTSTVHFWPKSCNDSSSESLSCGTDTLTGLLLCKNGIAVTS